jgi:hypothetical protein
MFLISAYMMNSSMEPGEIQDIRELHHSPRDDENLEE